MYALRSGERPKLSPTWSTMGQEKTAPPAEGNIPIKAGKAATARRGSLKASLARSTMRCMLPVSDIKVSRSITADKINNRLIVSQELRPTHMLFTTARGGRPKISPRNTEATNITVASLSRREIKTTIKSAVAPSFHKAATIQLPFSHSLLRHLFRVAIFYPSLPEPPAATFYEALVSPLQS
jgi:hypothetical protein